MKKKIGIILIAVFFPVFLYSNHARAGEAEDGQELFNGSARCGSCHSTIDKKAEELDPDFPELSDVTKRHTDEWLSKWIQDPQKTWEENDAETHELKTRVGRVDEPRTDMKKRKNFTDDEVKAMIVYLKSLSTRTEAKGKDIYNGPSGCASCHSVADEKGVGAGLAGVLKGHPEGWLIKIVKGHKKTIRKHEAKADAKKRKALTDDEVKTLMTYLRTL